MPTTQKIEIFLADENFDLRLVDTSKKLGHTVHTIVELNRGMVSFC